MGAAWSETLRRSTVALLNLGDSRITLLQIAGPTVFRPDGGLMTIRRARGQSSVSEISTEGVVGRALTPAHEETIYAGAVSRDGRILFVRGYQASDVVLVKAK